MVGGERRWRAAGRCSDAARWCSLEPSRGTDPAAAPGEPEGRARAASWTRRDRSQSASGFSPAGALASEPSTREQHHAAVLRWEFRFSYGDAWLTAKYRYQR